VLPMQEKRIHQFFEISVALKGVHALIEIAGGALLYVLSTTAIVGFVNRLTQEELLEDPNDFIATHLLHFAQGFSVHKRDFYAFYLVSHGLVKLVVVVGLLKEKLWAYPASFVVFGSFIAYQLYRYSYTHDFGLIVLSILDIIVIALAVHEYRLLRRHLPTH
jgi:uncharacterized membrane protein